MNNEITISILLPTRARSDALMSSIESLYNLADNPNTIEFLFGIDNDDVAGMENMLHNVIPWIEKYSVNHKIVVSERFGYVKLHKYFNALAEHSQGSWLFIWNDDAVMKTKSWDTKILEKSGQFKLLSVHSHNDHPYSIFPIIPRAWFEVLGHLSQHSLNDAYVSNIAYYLDIFERIDVHCDHDRFDITGANHDDTYNQREIMEGYPDRPGDFNHPDIVQLRLNDLITLATWMKTQGMDTEFFTDCCNNNQDPWVKLRANDTNNQVSIFQVGPKTSQSLSN